MSDEKELAVLSELNKVAKTENPEAKTEKSPIGEVENALSLFVRDAMDVTRVDFQFNSALQEELLKRLPGMSDNQIAALFSNTNVNLNDKISKVLGPTFQLMTSKQQAEMAKAQAEQKAQSVVVTGNDMRQVNSTAPAEALQGMTSLNSTLQFIIQKMKEEGKTKNE